MVHVVVLVANGVDGVGGRRRGAAGPSVADVEVLVAVELLPVPERGGGSHGGVWLHFIGAVIVVADLQALRNFRRDAEGGAGAVEGIVTAWSVIQVVKDATVDIEAPRGPAIHLGVSGSDAALDEEGLNVRKESLSFA